MNVGKLFGHKKQYDSQQIKAQPSVSRYIELLRILLAVNSNFFLFPNGTELNNGYYIYVSLTLSPNILINFFTKFMHQSFILIQLYVIYIITTLYIYYIYVTVCIRLYNLCIKLVERL